MGNAVLPLVAITNGVTGQHNITEETIAPAGEERAPAPRHGLPSPRLISG